MEPLVSVLVPTFNRPDYLRDALASVLDQSFGDFEVIVHDNGSSAESAEVVLGFGDPRIRYFQNASNIGTTANISAACARATGKYVAILGDDDLWHRDFLATLVAPLEQDETVAVAFCDHSYIDSAGRPDAAMAQKLTRRFGRHLLREGKYQPFDRIALVYRSICIVSAAVLRRADVDWQALPGTLGFGADLFIAYLTARTGKACYYTPRQLAAYRYHSGSLSSSMRRTDRQLQNARDAMSCWSTLLKDCVLTRDKRYFEMKLAFNGLRVGATLMRAGEWGQAMAHLRRHWMDGVLPPRVFVYHLVYALRLHRVRA